MTMKLKTLLIALVAGLICACCTSRTADEARQVRDIITRVNARWQADNSPMTSPFWHHAAYHTGNIEVYRLTGDRRWLDYSLQWARHNNWSGATCNDTLLWRYDYGETHEHVLFGDWQICFQTYADLYGIDPDPVRIARARQVMEYEMSTLRNDYWWWADGLYMVMPVMTKLHRITGNPLYLDKLYQYIQYSDSIMYDSEDALYYRDARYVYPGHKSLNGKKDFWSRGNGWVFAGLAKVLQDLPDDYRHRRYFLDRFTEMADAVVSARQDDGYWTRSLIDPEHAPGPETSGTAFFTYGLLWGINNGILTGPQYIQAALDGWSYLVGTALQPDDTIGYVQPIGDRAIAGEVVDSHSVTDFGTGAFLLAACEYVRYLESQIKF